MRLAVTALVTVALAGGCADTTAPPGEILGHDSWTSDAEPCPHDGPADAMLVRSTDDIDTWFDGYACDDEATNDWVSGTAPDVRQQFEDDLDDETHLVLLTQPWALATLRTVTRDGPTLYVSLSPSTDQGEVQTLMAVTVIGDVEGVDETVVHFDDSDTHPALQLLGGVGALLWFLGLDVL